MTRSPCANYINIPFGQVLVTWTLAFLGIKIPQNLGLRPDLRAVPKLRLWTSWSIHIVSLTANLLCLPIKTAGEMGQRLTNGVAPEAVRGVSQL